MANSKFPKGIRHLNESQVDEIRGYMGMWATAIFTELGKGRETAYTGRLIGWRVSETIDLVFEGWKVSIEPDRKFIIATVNEDM